MLINVAPSSRSRQWVQLERSVSVNGPAGGRCDVAHKTKHKVGRRRGKEEMRFPSLLMTPPCLSGDALARRRGLIRELQLNPPWCWAGPPRDVMTQGS